MSKFQEDIKQFNSMYKLPVSEIPTLEVGVPASERLAAFKNIITEELNEIDEIVEMLSVIESTGEDAGVTKLDALTKLSDLLGDLQVYCASEMAKFGLPLDETLSIIMESNFSKMGANGKPIYDERGKVLKGPNYWKPEPKLQGMLEDRAWVVLAEEALKEGNVSDEDVKKHLEEIIENGKK